MKVQVIGKERKDGDFIDKETKEQVVYDNTILYGVGTRKGVEGHFCAEMKIKTEDAADVEVGDVIVADVDRWGKVLGLDIIKKGVQ